MKEAALLVLLVVTLNGSCVGASLNNGPEQEDAIASLKIIYLENDTLHLTWELLNPTGEVRGFSLTWNDGAADKQAHESKTAATIGYPSNLNCSDKLTVTVIPLNDDNLYIGKKWTEKFDLHDVVTNITLTPEENMISASWSIKCPSQVHTETVVIWEEVMESHEQSCRFPSTARDTTAHAVCATGELILQPCQSYYVFIEPLDSQSSYTGIAGRRMSYTLGEESLSKLEEIELQETKSRSATLMWQGPNPERPGNHYVVTYTETRLQDGVTRKGEAKIVKGSMRSNQNEGQLITANLHPSDNSKVMGHLDNLQPFSRYEFCVAAGNTVTNLVCLTAQTLEEKPDRPSHISLTTGQQASTTIEVTWEEPSNMNGHFTNYIVRWHRDSKRAGSHNTTKHSYTIVDAEPCVSYTIRVTAVNGAGEGMAAEAEGVADNGCCNSASPTGSMNRETKDPSLSPTAKLAIVNQETSTQPAEISSSNETPTQNKWLTASAAGLSIVLLVILFFIIIKWRTSCQDFKKFIGLSCTNFQAEESAVESSTAPLPEQNPCDLRTVRATRTSMTESLAGHTYCYPNITPQVRGEIIGNVHRNDIGFQVEEVGTSPLYLPRIMEVEAVKANVGTSNICDSIIMQGKTMEALQAVKLLASLRIRESSELFKNELEVGTQEFSAPQAEKLGEAIRLLDEFLTMGGNSNDFSEIVGRPRSMTDSLTGHGYCYPNLSKEVIDQILSEAKMQQKMKRNRRRNKC